jgi:hypothetical protein
MPVELKIAKPPAEPPADLLQKAHTAFETVRDAMQRMVDEAELLAKRNDPMLWTAAAAKWNAAALAVDLNLIELEVAADGNANAVIDYPQGAAGLKRQLGNLAPNSIDSIKVKASPALLLKQAELLMTIWRAWCTLALKVAPDATANVAKLWQGQWELIAMRTTLLRLQALKSHLQNKITRDIAATEAIKADTARRTSEHAARMRDRQQAEEAERRLVDIRNKRREIEADAARIETETARIEAENQRFSKRLAKARRKGRAWAREFDRLSIEEPVR